MKSNTVYKRALNRCLTLVAACEVGADLGSETRLARTLGVSRTTVRAVLTALHDAGVVEREEPTEDGQRLRVLWTDRQRIAFEALDGARADAADDDDAAEQRTPGGWDPLGND